MDSAVEESRAQESQGNSAAAAGVAGNVATEVAARTGLSTTATGMTAFSEFAIGEPTAGLAIAVSDGFASVTIGDGQAHGYLITVSNAGPYDAAAVTLIDSWPMGFSQGSIAPSQGSCAAIGVGPDFGCSLGTIPASGSATVTVGYAVPVGTVTGLQVEAVSVASLVADPAIGNNSAIDTTAVVEDEPTPTPTPTPTPAPTPAPNSSVGASGTGTMPDTAVTSAWPGELDGPSFGLAILVLASSLSAIRRRARRRRGT